MYLLAILESKLGSIDTWPSYILRFLFVDVPLKATVRPVAGFFCGNKIECNLAAQFFRLCNDRAGMTVTEQIHQLYVRWQRSPWTYQMMEYYNMQLRRHLYLNGECCERTVEFVVLEPTPIALGPEGMGFGQQIRQRLELIINIVPDQ